MLQQQPHHFCLAALRAARINAVLPLFEEGVAASRRARGGCTGGRGREREDVGQMIVSNTSISTAAMCFHSCIHPSILLSCCTATHTFILKAQCGRVQQQQQTFATRRPTQPLRTNDSCVLGTASNAQRSATNSAEERESAREREWRRQQSPASDHTHTHNEDDSFFFLLWAVRRVVD